MKWPSLKRKQDGKGAQMRTRLASFLSMHHADLISFSYSPEYFGNIAVSVEYEGVVFAFCTDRGEIYCNNEFVCNNAYHTPGRDDTLDKLIEVIQSRLFGQP